MEQRNYSDSDERVVMVHSGKGLLRRTMNINIIKIKIRNILRNKNNNVRI